MKAMVVGAAGFVGPYLIDAIEDQLKCEIVATKLEHEKVNIPKARIEDLDITNPLAIVSLLQREQPDYIFHLAAQSSVAYSWKNPVLTADINIKGTLNLLDAIRQLKNSPRVLIIGSGEEYGRINPDMVPIKEDTELRPGNIYAVTKACQNQMATIYAHAYGLNLVLVRAFNHFGPKQAPTFVAADFCKQVVQIEKRTAASGNARGKSFSQAGFYRCKGCCQGICTAGAVWQAGRNVQRRQRPCHYHSEHFG